MEELYYKNNLCTINNDSLVSKTVDLPLFEESEINTDNLLSLLTTEYPSEYNTKDKIVKSLNKTNSSNIMSDESKKNIEALLALKL